MKRYGWKILTGLLLLLLLCAGCMKVIWSRYEEPPVLGGTVVPETEEQSVEGITEQWFQEWAEGHRGIQVPPSYRLKSAKILTLEMLSEEYIEVHYEAKISGWSRKVVENLELISTDEKNVYDGQWVLKWEKGEAGWVITEVMSPVQYQMLTPEFEEERNQPQTTHFAYNSEKQESYYAKDGNLYVTYDSGENFIKVPDGYEQVFRTPNGTYDEYLADNNYLIGTELTAFIGYSDGQTKLIYSTDRGENWNESVITSGGYRANSFLSKTEDYCYAVFALERTGGSDYYGTFRSVDLQSWETVSMPDTISNVTCAYWRDNQTGYYGRGNDGFYLTTDGGASYTLYDLPRNEELTAELGYNPYDSLERIYQEDGWIYMVIGQGEDGDYTEDGEVLKALFRSQDGVQFSFVEEIKDSPQEAG